MEDKVLITGGAGYLGSTLATKLLSKGFKVRIMDNFLYGKQSIQHLIRNPNFETVEGDVRDMRMLVKALNDSNFVIHLASIVGDQAGDLEPKTTIEINYLSTRALAGLCKIYGKKLLFASTCSVYGDSLNGVAVEDQPVDLSKPLSLYGETKLRSERAIEEELKDHVIFRLGTLFGLSYRMRFDLAINMFIAKAIKNEIISVYGGEQFRPFIHVSDAADAFIKALTEDWKGILNVAWRNWKIKEVATYICDFFGVKLNISEKVVDKRNYKVSIEKVNNLGFVAKRTIDDAISEIKNTFDTGLITDYKSEIHSNVRSLFESEDVQRKVYTLGPIGEKVKFNSQ